MVRASVDIGEDVLAPPCDQQFEAITPLAKAKAPRLAVRYVPQGTKTDRRHMGLGAAKDESETASIPFEVA